MDKIFNKTNSILLLVLIVLILIVVPTVIISNTSNADVVSANANGESSILVTTKSVSDETTVAETTQDKETEPTEETTKATEATETQATEKPTETQKTTAATQASTVQFATAIPAESPASYEEQWNAGYLVAIDNPDTSYQCAKVTLSESDRDLLERLCMGEYGSGGFVGACLIAQSVKNAMCFDGYSSVQDVIDNYHYTGSTNVGKNANCVNAVEYIFDENHDAVQHRLLYMYNPTLVQSAFHESQNYIMSYGDVRFFDRWGY